MQLSFFIALPETFSTGFSSTCTSDLIFFIRMSMRIMADEINKKHEAVNNCR
jgi:hypothetical protein